MNAQLLWTEAAVYEAHAMIELWVEEKRDVWAQHRNLQGIIQSTGSLPHDTFIQDGGLIRL